MAKTFQTPWSVARLRIRDAVPSAAWRITRRLGIWPPLGSVRMASLRRLTPISRIWGLDRGVPIDRYYIEGFLKQNASVIRGDVLEAQNDSYARRYGGDSVARCDVLSVSSANTLATIVANLEEAGNIPDNVYDCVILTQTLHLVYKVDAAVRTLHRILRPGGAALVTIPGISKVTVDQAENWCSQWAFTPHSATTAFGEVFGMENVEVKAHGNVLAAVAFLHGLASAELRKSELDYADAEYPVIIEIRAVKR